MAPVHDHFTLHDDFLHCNSCETKFKKPKDGSTSTLHRHLEAKHGITIEKKFTGRSKFRVFGGLFRGARASCGLGFGVVKVTFKNGTNCLLI